MTLVEIIIAVFLIAVGVTGLLGSSAAVAGQMGGGMRQTIAASIAQSRIDSLSSLACAQLATAGVASGITTHRGVKEQWSVADGRNIKTITVEITIPRRATRLRYATVIPCRD